MKKPSRGLYWVLGIVAVVGIFILLRGPQTQQKQKGIAQSLGLAQIFNSGKSNEQANSTNDVREAADEVSASAAAVGVAAEFRQWFKLEATNLEHSVQNPQAKDAELKEQAQKLTAAEVLYLKSQALAQDNTASDRIFGTYMLTLSASQSTAALAEIVQQPLNYPPVTEVHSVQENMAMQERSLRRMAIDNLVQRAQENQALRDELPKNLAQIPDANLREYAQKSYRRAFGGN